MNSPYLGFTKDEVGKAIKKENENWKFKTRKNPEYVELMELIYGISYTNCERVKITL